MLRSWLVFAVTVAMPGLGWATSPERIVSLGGDITETIYALDAQAVLVGVDSTSEWPATAHALPDVGYVRQLAAEGVLSLRPQLIIATHDAGPPGVLAQLRSAGVSIETLPVSYTPDEVVAKVRTIGHLLGKDDAATALVSKMRAQYAELTKAVATMPSHPRAVFMMSAGGGSPLLAGNDTAATHAMALAGGINAIDSYSGYKPVSTEAMAALAPDVIVVMRERADTLGGIDGVLKLPGVALTPAGKARRVILVDGQALLGFGPRNAAQELALQRELAAVGQ